MLGFIIRRTLSMIPTLLGVSISTVDNWTKAGLLTPIRFGNRCVRFDMDEVTALVEKAQAGAEEQES